MPCKQYRRLVRSYAEGDLPAAQERLLRDHVGECAECRRAVALIERSDDTIAAVLLPPRERHTDWARVRALLRRSVVALLFLLLLLALLLALYRYLGDHLNPAAATAGKKPVADKWSC